MKELVPYVNLETVKGTSGKIEQFVVRTVSYLPEDSTVTKNGEGEVADNVYYRPLTISYTGTSTTFKAFDVDFTINRKDIGLLERGVNVKVKSAVVVAQSADVAVLRDGEGNGGVSVDYEEGLV